MKRMTRNLLSGLFVTYAIGFGFSLVGCSSDNIPKGTIRSGIGVPTTITLTTLGTNVVTGQRIDNGVKSGSLAVEADTSFNLIATVKDELGNPSEGFNVLFAANRGGSGATTSVALTKGRAIASQTFGNTSTIPIGVRITAAVEDISTSIDIIVNGAAAPLIRAGDTVIFVP